LEQGGTVDEAAANWSRFYIKEVILLISSMVVLLVLKMNSRRKMLHPLQLARMRLS
jgi:hypothetical protein